MKELDFDILPDTVGYHLRRAQIALFANFNRAVGARKITAGQFGVLTLIGANQGLTQSALARAVGIERSTMVATIDLLQKKELVERRPSPKDRRSNALYLSEKGVAMVDDLKRIVREHEDQVLASLSGEEREALRDMLSRIWTSYS